MEISSVFEALLFILHFFFVYILVFSTIHSSASKFSSLHRSLSFLFRASDNLTSAAFHPCLVFLLYIGLLPMSFFEFLFFRFVTGPIPNSMFQYFRSFIQFPSLLFVLPNSMVCIFQCPFQSIALLIVLTVFPRTSAFYVSPSFFLSRYDLQVLVLK